MTVERTLGRVDADLARGDVAMARTRLTSLVRSLPQSLEARDRLAAVCRLESDAAEAGRWSYLSDERRADEVAAFERACGDDPVRIMRALRWWQGDAEDAGTETARRRLREVRARAEAKAGRTLEWTSTGREVGGSWRDDAAGCGCVLAVIGVLALAVVGAVTVVRAVL